MEFLDDDRCSQPRLYNPDLVYRYILKKTSQLYGICFLYKSPFVGAHFVSNLTQVSHHIVCTTKHHLNSQSITKHQLISLSIHIYLPQTNTTLTTAIPNLRMQFSLCTLVALAISFSLATAAPTANPAAKLSARNCGTTLVNIAFFGAGETLDAAEIALRVCADGNPVPLSEFAALLSLPLL
jgi:hypothetical protein